MPILNWIGKEQVVNHDKDVAFRLLNKDSKLSTKEDSENLIIEGDNLEALKALMPYYAGQVKCIYIDPPYNTGNEKWVYNDRVNSPEIRKWLGKVVGSEGEDLNRHDKWLCMMYPRLKLLRDLLADDGVIFISIDDAEIYNLRIILDDIFEEDNIIAVLPTVMNLKGNQDEFGFAGTHEYTVVYAKDKLRAKVKEFGLDEEEFEEWEEDEYGYFKKGANLKSTGVNAPREKRQNLYFPVYISDDNQIHIEQKRKSDLKIYPITDKKEMSWRWSKNKIAKESHNLIVIREGNTVSIYKKQRPGLGDLPSKKPKTIFYKPEYSSGNGTNQMKTIFGSKVFDNPKPLDLIKDLISLVADSDDIVLDSFAGSGTTAHAVLELNKEDEEKGNRKFILIQIPEEIKEDSTAYKAGFRQVIEVTRKRVEKVIDGVPTAKNERFKEGLGGGFQFMRLGTPLFDNEGFISEDVTFKDMAQYIYFTETKTALNTRKIDGLFIGAKNDTEYYLLFKGIKKNIIDNKILKQINKNHNPKVIYADKCLVNKATLAKHKITFKQIPYEVKVY